MGKPSDFTCEFYSDRGDTISDLIGQGKMCFTFMDTDPGVLFITLIPRRHCGRQVHLLQALSKHVFKFVTKFLDK